MRSQLESSFKEIGVGPGHAVVFLYGTQRTDSLDERVAEGRKFDRDVEECSDVSSRIFESSKAARVAGVLIDVVPIWPGIVAGGLKWKPSHRAKSRIRRDNQPAQVMRNGPAERAIYPGVGAPGVNTSFAE